MHLLHFTWCLHYTHTDKQYRIMRRISCQLIALIVQYAVRLTIAVMIAWENDH